MVGVFMGSVLVTPVATVRAATVTTAVHGHEEPDGGDPQPVAGEELDHDSPLRPGRTRTGAIST